jgi:hypothetical protein
MTHEFRLWARRHYRFKIHGQSWFDGAARRRRAARRQPAGSGNRGAVLSLAAITDPENLLLVFRRLRATGGQAAGLDGIRFDDLSTAEVAGALRHVARAIRQRRYRPYPTRPVLIAKDNGRFRELRIASVCDRIVAAALYQALAAILDATLLPGCYGFRPRRSVLHLLADLERIIVEQGRFVIGTDDIAAAFPSVRIDDLMDDYRRIIQDPEILWLIETVLRGHDGLARSVGLDQGNSMSPASLNIRLTTCLDRPLLAEPGNPAWLRWADNLIFPSHTVSEARQAIQRAAALLAPAGFLFKGEARPTNLRRQGARRTVLGFEISYADGRLRYGVPRIAWGKLRKELTGAHESEYPSEVARSTVRGWLAAYGPAPGGVERERVIRETLEVAAVSGFRELGATEELERCAQDAWQGWERVRRSVGLQEYSL